MPRFSIDPDIAKAKTLSTEFYTDLHLFSESKEKIFSQCWQFAGDANYVKEQGQCYPFTLLDNFLSEPLLLSRDHANQVHCLSNVCTHRGTVILQEPSLLHHLRCRYHGRLFNLDGKFRSMPEFREVQNFPTKDDDLAQLPIFQWGNMLFTSLSQQCKHELFFGEMHERIGWMPLDKFILKPEFTKHYTVDAHWALYCENYLEGFHIPFVHAGLNAVIDFGNYQTELFKYSNLQLGIAKEADAVFDLPKSSVDYGKKLAAYYFWVFPNMMFNFYPWGLSLNLVQPINHQQCRVSFLSYVWKEELLDVGAGTNLDAVELEDEEVVEAVQKGVRSRFYSHGRYSVTREQGTHHFHRLLAEFIS